VCPGIKLSEYMPLPALCSLEGTGVGFQRCTRQLHLPSRSQRPNGGTRAKARPGLPASPAGVHSEVRGSPAAAPPTHTHQVPLSQEFWGVGKDFREETGVVILNQPISDPSPDPLPGKGQRRPQPWSSGPPKPFLPGGSVLHPTRSLPPASWQERGRPEPGSSLRGRAL
jgi:hypothetical protein